MPVTIKEIARKSGVSYHSVSKVLNNRKSYVGKVTREKILAMARQLNYQPNYLANALRTGKSNCLGVACVANLSEISNFDASRFCAGIGSVAGKNGYFISLLSMGETAFEEKMLSIARSRMVDGLILLIYSPSYDQFSKVTAPLLQNENFPFVAIHETARKGDFPAVGLDSVKAGYLAAGHLLAQGYRQIGIIFNPELGSHAEFYQGYGHALREIGQTPKPVESTGDTPAQGYALAKQFLAADTLAPAYVIFSDGVASGFLHALKEEGKQVPEDIAVVGGENILKEGLYYTPLTAVDRKYEERGIKAAEILMDIMHKGDRETGGFGNYTLEPALVVRDTSIKRY